MCWNEEEEGEEEEDGVTSDEVPGDDKDRGRGGIASKRPNQGQNGVHASAALSSLRIHAEEQSERHLAAASGGDGRGRDTAPGKQLSRKEQRKNKRAKGCERVWSESD